MGGMADTQEWESIKHVRTKKVTVGPPKITRFEKARIVGARALQISMGAPILVDADENTQPNRYSRKRTRSRPSANHHQQDTARRHLPRYTPEMATC